MLSDLDAAWLAGFIDGEGHVGLHPLRCNMTEYYQTNVFVRHTHRPSVDHLVELLAELDIDVRVSMEIRPLRHKDSFRINVTGMERILRLADAVERFSVTKIEQWAIVREWCESRLTASPKGGYSDRERELAAIGSAMNRRGKGT